MLLAFFSRKGFYALNVQCMVDHSKKVIWAKYNTYGSFHDSSCFRDTKLYELLKEKDDDLFEKRLFIPADSAYAIESFISPPCDQPGKSTPEYGFN